MSETRKALMDVAEILSRAGWAGDDHSTNIAGNVAGSQAAQTPTDSTDLARQHEPREVSDAGATAAGNRIP